MHDSTRDYRQRAERPRSGRGSQALLVLAALVAIALVVRAPAGRLFGGAAGDVRVTTGIGERRTVSLSDGTTVDLGVESTLVHPRDFSPARREVTLTGEAFFTIAADSARPFVVTAAHGVIETSGAAVAIRAYPDQPSVRVVVAEGAVTARLAGSDSGTTPLGPRQVARISREGAVQRQRVEDTERFTSWRRGRIVLSGIPLREALAELGRWQDADLRIADSVVANRRVTAEFAMTQTFTEMLDEIALNVGAVYSRQGRLVTFRRER